MYLYIVQSTLNGFLNQKFPTEFKPGMQGKSLSGA